MIFFFETSKHVTKANVENSFGSGNLWDLSFLHHFIIIFIIISWIFSWDLSSFHDQARTTGHGEDHLAPRDLPSGLGLPVAAAGDSSWTWVS